MSKLDELRQIEEDVHELDPRIGRSYLHSRWKRYEKIDEKSQGNGWIGNRTALRLMGQRVQAFENDVLPHEANPDLSAAGRAKRLRDLATAALADLRPDSALLGGARVSAQRQRAALNKTLNSDVAAPATAWQIAAGQALLMRLAQMRPRDVSAFLREHRGDAFIASVALNVPHYALGITREEQEGFRASSRRARHPDEAEEIEQFQMAQERVARALDAARKIVIDRAGQAGLKLARDGESLLLPDEQDNTQAAEPEPPAPVTDAFVPHPSLAAAEPGQAA